MVQRFYYPLAGYKVQIHQLLLVIQHVCFVGPKQKKNLCACVCGGVDLGYLISFMEEARSPLEKSRQGST